MTDPDGITNQEDTAKPLKTSGVTLPEESEGTGSNVLPSEKDSEIKESSENYSPKPVEIAQKQYFESQKKLSDSKSRFWDRIRTIITVAGYVITAGIAFIGIFWAYKLNNLAEPIGGLKEAVQNLKDENKDLKESVKNTNNRLDEVINRILDKKQ